MTAWHWSALIESLCGSALALDPTQYKRMLYNYLNSTRVCSLIPGAEWTHEDQRCLFNRYKQQILNHLKTNCLWREKCFTCASYTFSSCGFDSCHFSLYNKAGSLTSWYPFDFDWEGIFFSFHFLLCCSLSPVGVYTSVSEEVEYYNIYSEWIQPLHVLSFPDACKNTLLYSKMLMSKGIS